MEHPFMTLANNTKLPPNFHYICRSDISSCPERPQFTGHSHCPPILKFTLILKCLSLLKNINATLANLQSTLCASFLQPAEDWTPTKRQSSPHSTPLVLAPSLPEVVRT